MIGEGIERRHDSIVLPCGERVEGSQKGQNVSVQGHYVARIMLEGREAGAPGSRIAKVRYRRGHKGCVMQGECSRGRRRC